MQRSQRPLRAADRSADEADDRRAEAPGRPDASAASPDPSSDEPDASDERASDHEGSPRHHPGAGRLREELRADGDRRLHVQGAPVGEQARDPRRRRGDLGRRGAARSTRSTARARSAARGAPTASARSPTPSGPSSRWHRVRSRCSRTEDAMGIRSRKPTSPGRRFQTSSDFSEVTKSTPGEVAARPQAQDRRAQRPRPQDRRATAVAVTSSSTASSTSSVRRTA